MSRRLTDDEKLERLEQQREDILLKQEQTKVAAAVLDLLATAKNALRKRDYMVATDAVSQALKDLAALNSGGGDD